MATRKKNTKKAINLNNKIMFIGGQAYQLKKISKSNLDKAQADQIRKLAFQMPDNRPGEK